MKANFDTIKNYISNQEEKVIELEEILTSIPSLAPENNGNGEYKKCLALEEYLKAHGITDLKHYDCPDSRVSGGLRPNLVATIPGKDSSYAVWVCAHLDVVPVGEKSKWNTDPWKATVIDGKIYGRGVEDNQQGLISGVIAALSFVEQKIIPEHTIKLLFMADEEVGSHYGMGYLVKEHLDIFGKEDRILIPDGGDEKGETIEIAEKNIAWFKFHTIGKQYHGSRPDLAKNAHLAACDLALRVHDMKNIFNKEMELFEPPFSTFEPTQKMQNVEGVNIIPGDDIFCADCRINPCYSLDEVRNELKKRISEVETKYGVKIEVEELQAQESKATSESANVVIELKQAIKDVHGIDARCIGIGGGTVGAELRNEGYDCVVWSTMDSMAHQVNEYAIIKNTLIDAQTIAYLVF